jgi:HK97 family phage portal protein
MADGWWAKQRARVLRRSATYSAADPQLAVMLGYTPADGSIVVTANTALTLSAVFRAVSIVAGSVASLTLRTIETDPKSGEKKPVGSFLDNPGGDRYTPFEWAELLTISIILKGEIFLQHIYNAAGALAWLNPVLPEQVSVYWDASRPGGKRFEVRQASIDGQPQKPLTLDATTMTQIMGMSLDGRRGISAIGAARMSLGTALAGDKAANRQFSQGAMIAGMVTPDGDEDFDEDEAKTIKRMVNRTMIGPEHAGDIPVINRRLKFSPWTMSAKDAQFIESRTFSIDEVGRWIGVPPHLLGLTEKSTSWGQGIAEQNRGLARYTLKSLTSRIEQRLSRLVASPRKTAQFDYTEFVAPSPEDNVNLIIAQVNAGLITPNEGRRRLNLAPADGGDLLRIPAGAANPAQQANSDPSALGAAA